MIHKYRGLTKDGEWVYGYFLINPIGNPAIYDPEIGDIPVIRELLEHIRYLENR